MDDEEAVDLIEDVLKDSSLQPLLMTHAALALARLQKRGAQATLQGMLRDDRQLTLTWASAATALGHVGDSESVPALLRLLGDESTPKLLRAFAAASLGLIADDDDLPWNSEIAMNIKRLIDIGCYRGLRWRRGLPMHGQRTKTNARTRKGPKKGQVGRRKVT